MSDHNASVLPARAVILDVAGVTAIGRSASASASAARASVSRFSLRSSLRIAGPRSFTISAAPYLPRFDPDAGANVVPRLTALAELAASQVSISPLLAGTKALPVFLGVPSARPGLPDDAASVVAEAVGAALSARGFAPTIETLPLDHASGLAGLERALHVLEARKADICLVGGVDSYLSLETLAWLHEREQLKSERNRWGFVPGEGAGFLVVVTPELAAAANLRPRATVLAAMSGREDVPPRTADPQTGQGLTAVLRAVLAALPDGQLVDEMVCDLNGERWRGDDAGFSIPRVSSCFVRAGRYAAPAMAFGDVGAASGALFVAIAVHAAERGAAQGPSALVWTSADAGPRAAALFSIPCRERE
jgi:3-oxoacyl-[acyl-carrier-protein] synthase-1